MTMDDAAIKKYLAGDYAKAVKFYDDRACRAKRWFNGLSIYLSVVAALLIPIVAFAPAGLCWRILAASLSASMVVSTALLAHFRCHENWLSYRGSWDSLERERRLFENGAGAYGSVADSGALFVERVEAILAREGTDFYARNAKSAEQTRPADD
ncbi:MAG: DUF4231 domain-containing protein [Burkholderiaceae bacterium]